MLPSSVRRSGESAIGNLRFHASPRPYNLQAAVLLVRGPQLTQEASPFENAYYSYQGRLARALSEPFPADFYFKKGTVLQRRFSAEERIREAQTFGVGFEGEEGDEKLEDVPIEEDEIKVLPRVSKADEQNDLKSLNRRGDRNLYLLVKSPGQTSWRFPHWTVDTSQALHKSVRDALVSTFGPNMNTWIVGRQPVAVQNCPPSSQDPTAVKTFFFKARILGGKPALSNARQVEDFAWLTKDEIQDRVDLSYWKGVNDLLPSI
ncbi:hypothetical protein BS47DRAFT_1339988 [Hydnum rufescens UP504]|uniref:Large ribosomal subunit protein mL46 n=1 Tax=Hydnum rufescens UP504 TaxID=1448309 RepID=A0A9P6DW94_9AGAM|nr:hypothetical protein BS47DRAFT_1339988 [Hydnum rufescens UP504]